MAHRLTVSDTYATLEVVRDNPALSLLSPFERQPTNRWVARIVRLVVPFLNSLHACSLL